MDRNRRHQHRTLQPQGSAQPQQPLSTVRLADSLDSIRQEFDSLSQESTLVRSQRDELENSGLNLSFIPLPFTHIFPSSFRSSQ